MGQGFILHVIISAHYISWWKLNYSCLNRYCGRFNKIAPKSAMGAKMIGHFWLTLSPA